MSGGGSGSAHHGAGVVTSLPVTEISSSTAAAAGASISWGVSCQPIGSRTPGGCCPSGAVQPQRPARRHRRVRRSAVRARGRQDGGHRDPRLERGAAGRSRDFLISSERLVDQDDLRVPTDRPDPDRRGAGPGKAKACCDRCTAARASSRSSSASTSSVWLTLCLPSASGRLGRAPDQGQDHLLGPRRERQLYRHSGERGRGLWPGHRTAAGADPGSPGPRPPVAGRRRARG